MSPAGRVREFECRRARVLRDLRHAALVPAGLRPKHQPDPRQPRRPGIGAAGDAILRGDGTVVVPPAARPPAAGDGPDRDPRVRKPSTPRRRLDGGARPLIARPIASETSCVRGRTEPATRGGSRFGRQRSEIVIAGPVPAIGSGTAPRKNKDIRDFVPLPIHGASPWMTIGNPWITIGSRWMTIGGALPAK